MAISTQTKVRLTAVARLAAVEAPGLVGGATTKGRTSEGHVVGFTAPPSPLPGGATGVAATTVVGGAAAAGGAGVAAVVPLPGAVVAA